MPGRHSSSIVNRTGRLATRINERKARKKSDERAKKEGRYISPGVYKIREPSKSKRQPTSGEILKKMKMKRKIKKKM